MFNLLRAEWIKAAKNYLLTSFLMGMLPVGFATLIVTFTLLGFLSETTRQVPAEFSTGLWTADILGIWGVVISFPGNLFGRMMPLAFMAVGFAGEYQWGTWRNILPRNRRPMLIVSKLVILITIVMLTLFLTSLIIGVGWGICHRIHDLPYGPAWSGEVLVDFLKSYAQTILIGLISLMILGGYAALSAMVTRSILGGLLLGFFFSVVDAMSLGALLFFRRLLDIPELTNLYQYTPTYNMDNLRYWFFHGSANTVVASGFTAEPSMGTSFAILIMWVIGLVSLAILVFQRQDITS